VLAPRQIAIYICCARRFAPDAIALAPDDTFGIVA
jgi:hypothetical protein